jgi:hypothetical protein
MDHIGQILDYLYERMQIDEAWAIRKPGAFTWWAGPLAQRVWAEAPRTVEGVELTTLHIETDLLADVPMGRPTWERLASVNRLCSLSAYVAHQASRAIVLHASVAVTADNAPMARSLALHALAIQVADAHDEAEPLAEVFGGRAAQSGHPTSGRRPDLDEMLDVPAVYEERGKGGSPFTREEIASLVHLDPPPWLMVANEPHVLLADLEFAAGRPARLEFDAAFRHDALGSGLQARLLLPVEPDAAVVQRLNAAELLEPDAHQLGAWALDEERGLMFSAFVPAGAYMPGLSRALAYHFSARNDWARALLFPSA